jgi:hypothetical protein
MNIMKKTKRNFIGIPIAIIGFLFLMSGKPMTEDPTILEPTILGTIVGLLLLVIGTAIIRKNQ